METPTPQTTDQGEGGKFHSVMSYFLRLQWPLYDILLSVSHSEFSTNNDPSSYISRFFQCTLRMSQT